LDATTERLWRVLEPYVAAEGIELDDLDVRGGGRHRLVQVVVDAPGGVDVDRVAELARGLSRVLDDTNPLDGSYTLEVGSPGLERALRRPAHYRKSVGREVTITTTGPVDGATHHKGVVVAADDETVTITTGTEADRTIPFDAIAKARTVFRWERSHKPGHK
jgi:ribosome maturation factor RimP